MTAIVFLIILGTLVLVHEFGHFIVAKKTGMSVEEFGFGFPPRVLGIFKSEGKLRFILGWRSPKVPVDGTIYSINLIPLGGFVKILGENNTDTSNPRSFINKPIWARFSTLIAGVLMNVIAAWVILSIGHLTGLPRALDVIDAKRVSSIVNQGVVIAEVFPNTPGEIAGLKEGDKVVRLNSLEITDSQSLQTYARSHPGEKFTIEVLRGSEILNFEVQTSTEKKDAPIGIQIAEVGIVRTKLQYAFLEGGKDTYGMLSLIATGLKSLVISKSALSNIGGPVEIARYTGTARSLGLPYVLQLSAFLSINLAVLNTLPIPALDGGRILFLIVEWIRGKRNNQKYEQMVNALGFTLLLALMVLVTIKDIVRIHS